MNLAPGPEEGGPSAISHEEGASIDVTAREVSSMAVMTDWKGSRTLPENENPSG
jgi:hypothetical protein